MRLTSIPSPRTPTSEPAHPPFRADVEGLRGIAVLLVVAYHVGLPGFGGGFVGVDVFFVLSGFLITGLLVAELAATGRIDLAAFYARRVRRLLPAASLVLVVALALGAWIYPPLQLASAAESTQRAAAFVSNLFFAAQATDYFGDGVASNPLLHTWSLSVEEQFYLVWPCVVLLAAGRHVRRDRLAAVLVTLLAASLAASWWYTIASRATAFYGMPTRAWEFAVGGVVALLAAPGHVAPSSTRLGDRAMLAGGWSGLGLVVGAAAWFTARTPFPGLHALIPVLGAALVLGGTAARGTVGRALATPALQWVGRHSYGWYLWHWPALALGAAVLPAPGLAARLALVAGALGLAALTRVLVEEPCRRTPRWRDRPGRVLALGLASVALLVTSGAALRRAALRNAQSDTVGAFTAAMRDRPRLYDDRCGPGIRDSVVRTCAYGPRDAHVTALLFGDSHAAHWFPALDAMARARGWRLLVVTKDACPSADVAVYEPMLQRVSTECGAWRRAALDTIRAHRPSFVVLSNSSEYVMGGPRAESRASVQPAEWERGLARTLGVLHSAGIPVALIQDTPRAAENIPACLTHAGWHGRAVRPCDFGTAGAVHVAAVDAERRALARFAEDRPIDLTAALCPAGVCPAVRDGIVRYRDAHHLTASAAAAFAPALGGALDVALPIVRR